MAETILIADDEPDVVELLVYHLKKAGFKTIAAGDGLAALNKAREELPAFLAKPPPGLDTPPLPGSWGVRKSP